MEQRFILMSSAKAAALSHLHLYSLFVGPTKAKTHTKTKTNTKTNTEKTLCT